MTPDERKQILAAKLRENLRRRKVQTKARDPRVFLSGEDDPDTVLNQIRAKHISAASKSDDKPEN